MHASGNFKKELIETAQAICAPGKGILAADESTGTIGKRFDGIGVENNHGNRQAYRELLFTTAGLEEHISGVIMFDETVRDTTADGTKIHRGPQRQGNSLWYQGRHRSRPNRRNRRRDCYSGT